MRASISAVVPAFNAGPYLRESLDSLLAQNGPIDELLVIDDGSTDETPDILASYGQRIRVIQGSHGGLSAARNIGVANAMGDLIAFHDADDVATPDRLETALAFLATHASYDAVFFNGLRLGAADSPAARVVPAKFNRRLLTAGSMFEGYPLYFQGGLVPRRVFESAGPFNPAYRIQPDLAYGYRIFSHCRATFVDQVVFHYRWHTTNMTRDRTEVRTDIVRILEDLETESPAAIQEIGAALIRRRLARHYHRIGRVRGSRGDSAGARLAFQRAAALAPLNPRYQWARFRAGG